MTGSIDNLSPWLDQLDRVRPEVVLAHNLETEVLIIGGGIAGVMTAFFVLRETQKSVVLIDAGRIGHAATGHNAGQIASYFERPFADIVTEYGQAMAVAGQQAVLSAWDLLDEVAADLVLESPYLVFTGYAGCQSLTEVRRLLTDLWTQKEAGMEVQPILVAEQYVPAVGSEYLHDGIYLAVPQTEIWNKLETKNEAFIAALPSKKGCTNSARLVEEIISKLLKKYTDRLAVYEQTAMRRLVIKDHHALATMTSKLWVSAEQVVLCTNGFEHFTIVNQSTSVGEIDVDTHFHDEVQGSVGYMSAYVQDEVTNPMAVSYLPEQSPGVGVESEPYFYLTRRPHKNSHGEIQSLVSIGGPERMLADTAHYQPHPYPEEAEEQIQEFLHRSYKSADGLGGPAFRWHGLMGYTPSGVRLIGPEPRVKRLWYNLGCNGVGILPSIYGGWKIGRWLSGDKFPAAIFDPK